MTRRRVAVGRRRWGERRLSPPEQQRARETHEEDAEGAGVGHVLRSLVRVLQEAQTRLCRRRHRIERFETHFSVATKGLRLMRFQMRPLVRPSVVDC